MKNLKELKALIIPVLLTLSGCLEMLMDGWEKLVTVCGWPTHYVEVFRFIALAITVFTAFLIKPPKKIRQRVIRKKPKVTIKNNEL